MFKLIDLIISYVGSKKKYIVLYNLIQGIDSLYESHILSISSLTGLSVIEII